MRNDETALQIDIGADAGAGLAPGAESGRAKIAKVCGLTPLLTAEEAAGLLKVLPQQVRRWANSGHLPGVQIGRCWRFKVDTVSSAMSTGLIDPAAMNYTTGSTVSRVGRKGLRSWRDGIPA